MREPSVPTGGGPWDGGGIGERSHRVTLAASKQWKLPTSWSAAHAVTVCGPIRSAPLKVICPSASVVPRCTVVFGSPTATNAPGMPFLVH